MSQSPKGCRECATNSKLIYIPCKATQIHLELVALSRVTNSYLISWPICLQQTHGVCQCYHLIVFVMTISHLIHASASTTAGRKGEEAIEYQAPERLTLVRASASNASSSSSPCGHIKMPFPGAARGFMDSYLRYSS